MGKRILAVDDNEDILETLSLILSLEGFNIQTAISPEKIEKKVAEFNPDLILLDIQMGEFDGLEVCKKLKSSLTTRTIPVLIISSHERIRSAITEFGANGTILKPFDVSTLVTTVASFIGSDMPDITA